MDSTLLLPDDFYDEPKNICSRCEGEGCKHCDDTGETEPINPFDNN
jgi:hypothetical protein